MKNATAFWDARGLVSLCVHEASSRRAESHLKKFSPVVWWGSFVEVHSALCRLHRDRQISDQEKKGAVARLSLLSRGWREILPSDQIREWAAQSLDQYSLPAAESMQLAASLMWCERRPEKKVFICGDHRLARAARSEKFSVLELPSI